MINYCDFPPVNLVMYFSTNISIHDPKRLLVYIRALRFQNVIVSCLKTSRVHVFFKIVLEIMLVGNIKKLLV